MFNINLENLYVLGSIITGKTIILAKTVVEKIKNKIRTFEPEIGKTIKNTQAEIQISSSYKKKACKRNESRAKTK